MMESDLASQNIVPVWRVGRGWLWAVRIATVASVIVGSAGVLVGVQSEGVLAHGSRHPFLIFLVLSLLMAAIPYFLVLFGVGRTPSEKFGLCQALGTAVAVVAVTILARRWHILTRPAAAFVCLPHVVLALLAVKVYFSPHDEKHNNPNFIVGTFLGSLIAGSFFFFSAVVLYFDFLIRSFD